MALRWQRWKTDKFLQQIDFYMEMDSSLFMLDKMQPDPFCAFGVNSSNCSSSTDASKAHTKTRHSKLHGRKQAKPLASPIDLPVNVSADLHESEWQCSVIVDPAFHTAGPSRGCYELQRQVATEYANQSRPSLPTAGLNQLMPNLQYGSAWPWHLGRTSFFLTDAHQQFTDYVRKRLLLEAGVVVNEEVHSAISMALLREQGSPTQPADYACSYPQLKLRAHLLRRKPGLGADSATRGKCAITFKGEFIF
jgi:hypothetical protein